MYFQQKTCVLHFGRALTQNSWICHIISYLWMVGLVMRLFFPVGPTFGDHQHVFSQKRSSPLEFIFDTCASASSSHLFWLVKLNICGCSLLLGQMYVQPKIMCFAFWARVDTKFLNLSHHVLSMDGWPGDATSSPLDFIFDTCASASSSHLFWLVKLNICGCSLLLGQMYFQQKTCVLHFGRALTQNSWICHIISYLWMVGLVMRPFFSCGANLWRSSACIQPKKVQPLGIYFWHLRLGLFKSAYLVGEAEHMWLQPFARTNVCSAKNHVFCILGARWHKILEFVPSCPIYGWLAWWCDFFPVGPTFEDHQHVFSQKRSSPLESIFDTCASASSSHLFWLVKLNICGCSLLLGQMYFQQTTCVLHFGRAFRTNVPLCKDKCIFRICSWCLTYAHSAL